MAGEVASLLISRMAVPVLDAMAARARARKIQLSLQSHDSQLGAGHARAHL